VQAIAERGARQVAADRRAAHPADDQAAGPKLADPG
jgi:hypothetical protein